MFLTRYVRAGREIASLKYFIRGIKNDRYIGVVEGMPGAGKTLLTTIAVKDMFYEGEMTKALFAEPQRYLRDYVAQKWLPGSFVVKARDEVCKKIAKKVKEEPEKDYLLKAFEECTKCPHYRKDSCPFYGQFKKLVDMSKGIVVTTHHLAPITTWLFKPDLLIFDEAEDYLQVLSKPIDPKVLEELEKLDEKTFKRIKSNLTRYLNKYYLKPAWFSVVGSKCLMISATFPDYLKQFIGESYGRPDELLWIPTHTISSPSVKDMVLSLNDRQVYRKSLKLEDQFWWRQIIPRLISMVNASVERFGAVSIVSKNKVMTEKLHEIFTGLGYRVTSDALHEKPDRDAEVWVATVRGKWYRGVSLRPSKVKGDRKDFPVVLAFYQAQNPNRIASKIPPFFWDWELNVSFLMTLCRDLIRAENVQTLFRFNRERDKQHLMVLFDKRLTYALELYFKSYVNHLKHKETVDTLNDLERRFLELVEAVKP